MRIYIAGRVTGLNYDDVKAKFGRAENSIRAVSYNPVNPLKYVNALASAKDAMKICIPLLMECDAILLLPDWEFSEGAQIEAQIARYVGITLLTEDDLTQ
jgi:hypothetical protein